MDFSENYSFVIDTMKKILNEKRKFIMSTIKNTNSGKIKKQIAAFAAIACCAASMTNFAPADSFCGIFESAVLSVSASNDPTIILDASSANQELKVGTHYNTPDKKHYVIFQNDGNLVVYTKDGKACWYSGTHGRGGNRCVLQNDGNLVIYNNAGAIWHTASNGKKNPVLKIQNGGTLTVYSNSARSVTWTSTNSKGNSLCPNPIESGYYTISASYAPSMCIDINGIGTANGTNVQLWNKNNTAAQTFYIQNNGSGIYRISPAYKTDSSLDLNGNNCKEHENIQLWSSNNSGAQDFIFVKENNNEYSIRLARNTSYCLDVQNRSTANGANIQLYKYSGDPAQRFKLEKTTGNLEKELKNYLTSLIGRKPIDYDRSGDVQCPELIKYVLEDFYGLSGNYKFGNGKDVYRGVADKYPEYFTKIEYKNIDRIQVGDIISVGSSLYKGQDCGHVGIVYEVDSTGKQFKYIDQYDGCGTIKVCGKFYNMNNHSSITSHDYVYGVARPIKKNK